MKHLSTKVFIVAIFVVYTFGLFRIQQTSCTNSNILQVMTVKQESYDKGYVDGVNTATKAYYENLSTNPQVNALFKKYFPKPEEAKVMRAIMIAETTDRNIVTGNTDGSYDCGLFAINTVHAPLTDRKMEFCNKMLINENNFKQAKDIQQRYGYTPWVVFKNNTYTQYVQ